MPEPTAVQATMARAAGQIDRLQAANDRQRHALDSMLAFLRERGLVNEYNVWAGRGGVRIKREIADVELPDKIEPQ